MLDPSVVVKVPGGGGDLTAFWSRVESLAHPTVGDLLYAGQRQRSRILQRTERGVDVNETAFAPYSTHGPYYYYPNKSGSEAQRAAATNRFAKKLGIRKGVLEFSNNREFNFRQRLKIASAERTRLGIKFSSYAAFKSFLGRTVVDLYGAKAPHMLQAMIVKVGGIVLSDDEGWRDIVTDTAATSGLANNTPANEIIIGIYGQEAERAEGHNIGAGHLPQRRFLSASDRDKFLVLADVCARVGFRVRAGLKGTK